MEDPKEPKEEQLKPWWAEVVKDITATGLATIFMTEDSVRSYLKDKKFPKETAGLLLEGLSKKKDDLYALIAGEVGKVLSKIDITAEVGKFMEKHKLHIDAKISFEPRHKEPKGDAK